MEEALVAYLLANAGVAALAGTRIYWGERPQGDALPAIVLFKVSPNRDVTLAGPSGLIGPRVQIDCLGGSYALAKTTARAVIAAADAIGGTAGFQGAFLDAE